MSKYYSDNNSGISKGLGIGLAAAAAGAAVTYFLYGTETGNEKRKKLVGWAKDTADKTTKAVSELASVSKDMYSSMTDMLKEKYDDLKELNKEELSAVADQIRNRWQEASDDIADILEKATA